MRLAKRMLIGIGALALVVSILSLVTPKAMHGAAAVLVSVVNTTAAPALTLDISKSASQHIDLRCANNNPVSYFCTTVAQPTTPYVVPPGQNFVVTSIDIFSETGGNPSGTISYFIMNSSTGFGSWAVPADGLTHAFQYPSGIVFGPGVTFSYPVVNWYTGPGFEAYLRGYLTPI